MLSNSSVCCHGIVILKHLFRIMQAKFFINILAEPAEVVAFPSHPEVETCISLLSQEILFLLINLTYQSNTDWLPYAFDDLELLLSFNLSNVLYLCLTPWVELFTGCRISCSQHQIHTKQRVAETNLHSFPHRDQSLHPDLFS